MNQEFKEQCERLDKAIQLFEDKLSQDPLCAKCSVPLGSDWLGLDKSGKKWRLFIAHGTSPDSAYRDYLTSGSVSIDLKISASGRFEDLHREMLLRHESILSKVRSAVDAAESSLSRLYPTP